MAACTGEDVVVSIADQRIVILRADQVLDARQSIALGIAAMAGAVSQIDRHAGPGTDIAGNVIARTADQVVGPGTTGQCIVAIAAIQAVIPGTAIEMILATAAGQDVVAVAAGQDVVADPAIQRIVAIAAADRIVSAATLDDIVISVAGQVIVVVRANQVLDARKRITLSVAAQSGPGFQIHNHTRRRAGIVCRVDAAATDQGVRAGAADQRVIASSAIQHIAAGIAGQRVVVARSGDILDARQDIAFGIAAMAGAGCQVDIHPGRRAAIVHRIRAVPARNDIRTATTGQDVVAVPTIDDIVPPPAIDHIVAGITGQRIGIVRTGQVFDARKRVALSIAAKPGSRTQIDRHSVARARIIRRVGAAATNQGICTAATDQRVVAGAAIDHVVTQSAIQHVVSVAAGQRVIAGRTRHVLDAAETVPFRIAARGGIRSEVDRHAICRAGIAGRIGAAAADQGVRPGTAGQRVIAGATIQHIVTGIASQAVALRRTGQVLDAGQCIAGGIATGAGARCQVHCDAAPGAGIARGIRAATAGQRIRAGTADQRVVAITTIEDVIPGAAAQQVGAGIPGQGIGLG